MEAKSKQAYRKALADTLPDGHFWKAKDESESNLYKILISLALSFSNLDVRANELSNEFFPQLLQESIDEWEIEYGLPSDCVGALPTFADRKAQVLAKFAGIGGQDPAYYVNLASDLGFDVEIIEFNGVRYTKDRLGDQYAQTTHPYVWYVNVLNIETIYAQYTQDKLTESQYSKLGVDTSILECLITKLKPAHTQVLFFYP